MTLMYSFRKTNDTEDNSARDEELRDLYEDLPEGAWEKLPRFSPKPAEPNLGTMAQIVAEPGSEMIAEDLRPKASYPSKRKLDKFFNYATNASTLNDDKKTLVDDAEKRAIFNDIFADPKNRDMSLFYAGVGKNRVPVAYRDDPNTLERILYAITPQLLKGMSKEMYAPTEITRWDASNSAPISTAFKDNAGVQITDADVLKDLFSSIAPRFSQMKYGYMRDDKGSLRPGFADIADQIIPSLTPTDIISLSIGDTFGTSPWAEFPQEEKVDEPLEHKEAFKPGVPPDRPKKDKKSVVEPTRQRKGKAKADSEEESTAVETETATESTTKSASAMFADMRAARNARKSVAVDESGNVDVVKSSTSSLFDRMRRHR